MNVISSNIHCPLPKFCPLSFTGHWLSFSMLFYLAWLFAAASSWPGSPRGRVRCWPTPAASPSRSEIGSKKWLMNELLLIRYTEPKKSLCTWFGEFCSCCCLPLLPQLACSILPTKYKDFFWALYIKLPFRT